MKDFPLYWIPLLPLLGAAINILVGRKLPRRGVHLIAVGSVVGAAVVAMVAVFRELYPMWVAVQGAELTNNAPALTNEVFTWIAAGNVDIAFGLRCDPLGAVMITVVTFVGSLIHIYSMGYMADDRDYARFFGYLNLFTGSMLILVLGDSLPVLFVGWEGVGACSYLLISFWYDKNGTENFGEENASAGKKAFVVNRIGDLAFILGMFVIFIHVGTLEFTEMSEKVGVLATDKFAPLGFGPYSIAAVAGLLLFIGACGKSAQIPLYIWLPDAMAGPTPVSALIHAATMVTAGVYMIARLNFLFVLTPTTMGIIALVGALTALFAATIGLAQNDIKKVLAYSTISQLGYMFLGVGMGAFAAGVFHLFTHAFFKACLFLGAGAVIHALHGEQDMRQMGGLRKKLPITHWTFLASTIAIAGIVPFSGFFSKDEILWKTISTANAMWPSWFGMLLYVIAMAGAFCTAFYMFRLYFLTFAGENRTDPHVMEKLHPPGPAMAMPLVVLAVGATFLGWLGIPGKSNLFHHWLAPSVDRGAALFKEAFERGPGVQPAALAENHALEYGLMGVSVAIAVVAILLARSFYGKGPSPQAARIVERIRPLHAAVENKYYVDEIYGVLFVRPFKAVAWLLFRLADRVFVDIIGIHSVPVVIRNGVNPILRRLQSGNVQTYLVALVVGIASIAWWIGRPPSNLSFDQVPGASLQIGEELRIDATREFNPEGRDLRYRWDFDGDGEWDTAPSPSAIGAHTYKKAGSKTIVLQVTDERWLTSSRETIKVDVVDPNAPTKTPEEAR